MDVGGCETVAVEAGIVGRLACWVDEVGAVDGICAEVWAVVIEDSAVSSAESTILKNKCSVATLKTNPHYRQYVLESGRMGWVCGVMVRSKERLSQ